MGVAVAPLTTAVMGSVDVHRAGVASGVNNAISRASGLVAIAALGVVLRARFDGVLDEKLAVLRLPSEAAARVASERSKLGGADFTGIDTITREAVHAAFSDAYVDGFRTLMVTSALLAVAGAVVAWALIEARPPEERRGG